MSTAEAYVTGPLAVRHDGRIIALRDLVILCLAVAACCASFVFALLYNSDQEYPVAAVQQRTAAAQQTPLLASPTMTQKQQQPPHIEFTLHRANTFQPVGPIRLGIWRIDARHDSVHASILVSHRRIDLNRIAVNERVMIPASASQELELVINHVSKNEVTGYVAPIR